MKTETIKPENRYDRPEVKNRALCMLAALILIVGGGGIGAVSAQTGGDQVVINSGDWIDVYTGICHANLHGMDSYFVTGQTQGHTLARVMDPPTKAVTLIESDIIPIMPGYQDYLESEGFTISKVIKSAGGRKLALELGRESGTTRFIVIDDAYGYNAISVAPYSIVSTSWVIFADRENINEVNNFLRGRTVSGVTIVGQVDRSVSENLARYNPEIINEKNDRFRNNIAVVDRYLAVKPSNEVIITNGEFIEEEIMSGRTPVIFINRNSASDTTLDYVKESSFVGGTIIGNDLANAVKILKDQTGLVFFIKLGQGRGGTGGGFSGGVEALDMFNLPKYEFDVTILSGNYNTMTNSVNIEYGNLGSMGAFGKGTVDLYADDKLLTTIGDTEPFFLSPETTTGRAYQTALDAAVMSGKTLRAHVFLEYGESSGSLTEAIETDILLGTTNFSDSSRLHIIRAVYNTQLEQFSVVLTNPGNTRCFASAEVELSIEGRPEFVSLGIPAEVTDETTLKGRFRLTPADLAENPTVRVHVHYGEHENMRINSLTEEHALEVYGGINELPIVPILVSVISILVVLLGGAVLFVRKKNE